MKLDGTQIHHHYQFQTERQAIRSLCASFYNMCVEEVPETGDYISIFYPEYNVLFSDTYVDEESSERIDIPLYLDQFIESEIDAPASGWWEETWRKPNLKDQAIDRWMGFHATEPHAIDYFL